MRGMDTRTAPTAGTGRSSTRATLTIFTTVTCITSTAIT